MSARAIRHRPQRTGDRPAPASAHAVRIGRAAVLALHDELALAPKPGLVSFVDSGSHADMDAGTFLRSITALRGYFVAVAALGADGAAFVELEREGIAAERRMVAATGGPNTHRGAVFALGLLCAAAGAIAREGGQPSPDGLRAALRRHWGAALTQRRDRVPTLPGGLAARAHGLRSASDEAAAGFPVLFETAVPAWQAAQARGLPMQRVQLDTFFAIMAVLDDANLARRGGREGLCFARDAARDYLSRGGAAADPDLARAGAIHRDFVARRLSPGGCADMLAATSLVMRIDRPGCAGR